MTTTVTQNNKQPHLVIITNSAHTFLSHRLAVALAAKAAGYKVSVLTPTENGDCLLAPHGLAHYQIPLSRSSLSAKKSINSLRFIHKKINKLQPSVIHVVAMLPILFVSFLNRFWWRKTCICAVVGLGYGFTRQEIKWRVLQQLLIQGYRLGLRGKHNRLIFQNKDDQAFFEQKILKNSAMTLRVKGAGVCLNTYSHKLEPKTEKIRIVLPARMLWDKGIGEFIEAAKLSLAHNYHHAMFILAGDIDPDNRACIDKATILEWMKLPNVEWLGHQSDMASVLQNCHIVCLPSYREGMPKALLEAAACGRPVVTTDVPGCREAIKPNETGFLVPAKQSVALFDKLLVLINDKQLREKFGEAGRLYAEQNFSIEHIVSETLKLYR